MPEDLLIRWTIRLSMLCYVAFLWISLGHAARPATRRAWWTAGVLLMVAHVVAAFHFTHHWSHTHALLDTARQTRELMGWEFGQGIYFSYLFLAVWIVDATWWWVSPNQYAGRPHWLSSFVHCYILFIAINGCIVFETGITRWASVLATAMLLTRIAALRRIRRDTTI